MTPDERQERHDASSAGLFSARAGAPTRRPLLGYAAAGLSSVCFATSGNVAVTVIRDGVVPADLSQFRVLGSFAVLLALAPWRPRALRVERPNWWGVVLFGTLGIAGVQLTYYEAIARIPIAVAGLLQNTGPIMVLSIAMLVFRLRPGAPVWALTAVALAGLVAAAGLDPLQTVSVDPLGIAFALLSAACFAVYFLAGEALMIRLPLRALLTWGYGVGVVVWLLLDLATGHVPALPSGWLLARVLVVVLLGTLIPTALGTLALRLMGASSSAVSSIMHPPLAGFIAWFALDQRLAGGQVAGGLAALVAIGLLQVLDVRAEHARRRRDGRTGKPGRI